MPRILAAIMLWLLFLVPAAAEFSPSGLPDEATAYAERIRARAPAQQNPTLRESALAKAAQSAKAGRFQTAADQLEEAIAHGDGRASTWLALSTAWTSGTLTESKKALLAAYNAYRAEGDAPFKRRALERVATLLDEHLNQSATALDALEAALALESDEALTERVKGLRTRVGLRMTNVEVQSEGENPQVCFEFSYPLSQAAGVRFQDYFRFEPAVALTTKVDDRTLCLSGPVHGTNYRVTVREGLPGADGVVLKTTMADTVRIGDQSPTVAFRGDAFILARGLAGGVPVVTVNLDTLKLKLLRINDRNLVREVTQDNIGDSFYEYSAGVLAKDNGELIWEGKLAVGGPRNQRITTAIPVRDILPDPKPGLYVLLAEAVDVPEELKSWEIATQWLMISDLGLTALRGADGIDVFARSFGTALPATAIELALIARNNKELGRITTDANGRGRFAAGLTRGTGGNSPAAVMAYGADGDFAMLDLTRSAFDLSDRGVSGREQPGPLDAYLYTDRGVYRPGETVNLSVLLRNAEVMAVEGLPLTVKVLRPGGTEFYKGLLNPAAPGGYVLPIALTRTAPMGGWSVEIYADPAAKPIGYAKFQVEDFVPERLAVAVAGSGPSLSPGQPFEAVVDARFLYGPPAAGLDGKAELSLELDPEPFAQWRGWQFGLVTESHTARLIELSFPTTDETGQAKVAVELPELPDITRPLRAELRIEVTEPGGRPSRAQTTVPIRHQPFLIGIKPVFGGGAVQESALAEFDLVAIDQAGTAIAQAGVRYELIEEKVEYQWYLNEGRYNYRMLIHDSPVDSKTITTVAGKPKRLTFGPLRYGRYRLEAVHEATRVASSVRFTSGWWTEARADDTPDQLVVAAERPTWKPGETARLRISPPFAGEALVTVLTDRVHTAFTTSVPAEGKTIEVPVLAEWGPGAYVTATVYRPPVAGKDRLPVRALGLAWVGVDTDARTYAVAIEGPTLVRPRQKVEIPVRITATDTKASPAADQEVFLTLAAVDEGILRLTDFVSPNPAGFFFGKRALGIDIRDDYGRLIDVLTGPPGQLRQGGDSGAAALPVVPFKVVSLFQGPVKVGADGVARLTLDIPDFNGEVRLMAVAFGHGRVGSAARPLTVRDALVAEVTLPRFLAPGDESTLTLSVHNVEAAGGPVQVAVETGGPIAVDQPALALNLAAGARETVTRVLRGTGAGIGDLTVRATGPDGVEITRNFQITVRPARPVESLFMARRLEPGATARIEAAQLAAYLPGTQGMSVSVGTTPPFDVAGLLGALDRFPYGCLEQVVSRGLPLLFVNDLSLGLGTASDEALPVRVDRAISQVLDKQRYDGSFGLWSAAGDEEPWLTAYATEFLVRARAKGQLVPAAPLESALNWLRRHAVDGPTDPAGLAGRAYALHVLALAGVATAGPIRYFYNTFFDRMPSPLARAQVAAALARLGSAKDAAAAFDVALDQLAREYWHTDYGSTVRDSAALVTLLAEANLLEGRVQKLLDRMPMASTAVKATSTQEQAWLVLAANTLMAGGRKPLALTLDDRPAPAGDPVRFTPTAAQLVAGVTLRNGGKLPVWQAVSIKGVPMQPPAAAREGLRIKRNFLNRDGTPLNLDTVHQNDVFVLVLEGEATTKLLHQAIVVHPLPAGWEIENGKLGGGEESDFPWLTDLTDVKMSEARDDRYVAAVDLDTETPRFKVAFLVRAVTPGSYELPGAHLEDMYKPNFYAQQATGRVFVLPAEPAP